MSACRPPAPSAAPCPCGRQGSAGRTLAYAQCCGRYLDALDHCPAPDAESLMRSRYSAFVVGRSDYLLATWHASQRPAAVEFEPGVKWLGLEVRHCIAIDANHADVEFVARSKAPSQAAVRLHERSRFVREAGVVGTAARWYYVDGTQQP